VARLLLRQPAGYEVVLAATGAEDPAREAWGRIAALVLAGGAAARFGRPKLLEPWGQTTILGRVLDQAVAMDGIEEVIVVAGCESKRIAAEALKRPVRVVFNDAWPTGQASSVRAGIAALRESASAVLVLLGDQPEVKPETLDALFRRHRQTLAPIVAPSYLGQRGNPVLFDRSLFDELGKLSGDSGGRVLIQRLAGEVEWVHLDYPAPFDIDTVADLRRHTR
jgi:molybdenum cofactor cytidylyltransferase